jgi:transposase
MIRHRLTDEQWELIADLFPPPKRMGRPPRDPREIMDGILWILRTGSPWRDLPGALGSYKTTWHLFNRWNQDGTLDRVLERLRLKQQLDPELWCIDGTIVRAARCASGGGKKTIRTNRTTTRSGVRAAV